MIPLPNLVSPFINATRNLIAPWVQYLQQFTQAPPNINHLIVGASPFSYTAKEPGNIFIIDGTISSTVLNRGLIALDFTGVKCIPVAINDTVTVTYSVLPNIYFIPSYGQNTGAQ